MHLATLLNSSLTLWALLGLVMLVMALLAFLRRNQILKEKLGILIIGIVLLLFLLLLTLGTSLSY
jgi:hypothetical protein